MNIKDTSIAVMMLLFAGHSTLNGYEKIASISLLLFVIIIYKHQVGRLMDTVTALSREPRPVKLAQMGHQVGKEPVAKIVKSENSQKTNGQLFPQGLDDEDIGLLNDIMEHKRYQPKLAVKKRLAVLKTKGFIAHNQTSMAKSTEVWLTDKGKELLIDIYNRLTMDKT